MDEASNKLRTLTTEQVADLLQLSSKTVTEMMRNGELPAMRVGGVWRVRAEALESWMKNQETAHPMKSTRS